MVAVTTGVCELPVDSAVTSGSMAHDSLGMRDRATCPAAELDYVRQTGASVETAKEVKIFGLNAFLIDRYRQLAAGFYAANRQLAIRRASWGSVLTMLGTVGDLAKSGDGLQGCDVRRHRIIAARGQLQLSDDGRLHRRRQYRLLQEGGTLYGGRRPGREYRL